MKKLAIMFVMLLGSVATMQAQTFDFSCVVPNADSFSPLSDGFDDIQMDQLTTASYTMEATADGHETLAKIFPAVTITLPAPENGIGSASMIPNQNARVSVLVGSFIDGRDDTNIMGPFRYRVTITAARFSTFNILRFFNSREDVIAFLLAPTFN